MTIAVGEKIPASKLTECVEFDPENGCPANPQAHDVNALLADKKVVIFTVPGAFTPLCSAQHLPGFVAHADAIKAAGADEIWCVAPNDAFVMAAWGRENHAEGKVRMMADGSADFIKALGLDRDMTANGMGMRCYRTAMIIDDGTVSYIGVEGSGEFGRSKAETILELLSN